LLSKDSYLLEGLQSADKTKTHPKAVTKRTYFHHKRKPFTFENRNVYLPIV